MFDNLRGYTHVGAAYTTDAVVYYYCDIKFVNNDSVTF